MEPDFAILSAVIATIYDAAIDPTSWQLALQRACDFVGGAQAVMFWQGSSPNEVDALYLYNDDPHFTRLYLTTFAPFNPVFPKALFMDTGAVLTASDLVPDDEMQETRFHREWLVPQGMTDSLAVLLERDAAGAAFLSIPYSNGAIGDDVRQRMALLVPHFQRAVAIGRLFVKYKTKEAALTETLNHIDAGVFLLAGNREIVFANAAGHAMTQEGSLLRVKGNSLSVVSEETDRALRDGLRAIETGDALIGARGLTIALSDTPDHRWIANILPLRDGERLREGEIYDAHAAVFVRDSRFNAPAPLEIFANLHKLTASEIRVVDASVKVSGLKAIAEMLGISVATVKTHLNRVYRKCGARNQSDLIKLIAGIGS